ncbi:PREDICTED: uncharacterized protein LOC109115550 [Nelumbo nucifera]|uniref:Uncharacterized protein LOC109115550 n=1 Tax=Nelumbo nucifera TaxID=4432 RepID=A0A1U8QB34_NELNU|nr:PREDICTED: uncharacterized protein LOC109115550 [Nelumbo nucifera]
MTSVRVLLSLVVSYDWPLYQFDVKNAFLNSDLTEEVYMSLPLGIYGKEMQGKVCRLKKSLYSLKQSPRVWFDKFRVALIQFGYTQTQSDHTLFVKKKDTLVIFLIVYVDDIVVTSNDIEEVSALKKFLSSKFEIKDLGELWYFLGIEVARSKEGIFISQRKYVLDLLTETGKLGTKPASTPIDVNHKLSTNDGELLADRGVFQRLLGKLLYLYMTRLDISYAMSVISQFMHAPRETHMTTAKKVLCYLKGTPVKGILFAKHRHMKIEVYTNANWVGNVDGRRSTLGYCAMVAGDIVSWSSKKQTVVARSSSKAKYRAMAHGVSELIWLKSLLNEMGVSCGSPVLFTNHIGGYTSAQPVPNQHEPNLLQENNEQ